MKARIWTDEMIYDIDKMPVSDFVNKYNISKNLIWKKRRELGIKNKGVFNPNRKQIRNINNQLECFCKKCNRWTSIDNFLKDKKEKSGLGWTCLECSRKRSRERNKTEAMKKYQREYKRNKRKSVDVKIFSNIRRGITRFIKQKNRNFGKSKYLEILGCSIDEFKQHLENLFQNGMTWENYGKYWHIDHIIPSRAFSVEQLSECWNYKNLQPLLAQDNFIKNDRLPDGTRARDL